MNRTSLAFIILFMQFVFQAVAQDNKERVYVHLNTQNLIAGETLMLSAYCRSQLTGKSSNLSKVLYVEIIGASGSIYQEKIRLENGRGSAKFFVSSLISTGKYYLVAYTRWMKNFDDYFKSSIEIINPFAPWPTEIKQHTDPEVIFYVDEGGPVAGLENTVGFKIISNARRTQPYKGRIVRSSGDVVATVEHDNFGIGAFRYEPSHNETYSLLLEDELGKILFYKLPPVQPKGITSNLDVKNNLLTISLQSSGLEGTTGKLTLYNENARIAQQLVDLNSRSSIDLRSFSGELFKVEISDVNDNIIVSKVFNRPNNSLINIEAIGEYTKRSKVDLKLGMMPGTYSISVRKKDKYWPRIHNRSISSGWLSRITEAPMAIDEYLSEPNQVNFAAFLLGTSFRNDNWQNNQIHLPEFRHEFLDGKLASASGEALANEMVALTIFNEDLGLQMVKTDKNGNFSLPYESKFIDSEAIITPLGMDPTVTLTLASPFINDFPDFDYAIQPLDSNQLEEIIAKSVRVQIENAYYKADSISLPQTKNLTQFDFDKTYILDEYTRFNSLKETFVEYILEASVRERRDPILKPHFTSVPERIKEPPLILLDGVPVKAERLLEFSASNIEQINILNNRYFLGPLVADGIINFRTFEGRMGRYPKAKYHHLTTIKGLKEDRMSVGESWQEVQNSRIPDQRGQLYWNPEITIDEDGALSLEIFTSDVVGEFEIIIEGFQNDGRPVSVRKMFRVN